MAAFVLRSKHAAYDAIMKAALRKRAGTHVAAVEGISGPACPRVRHCCLYDVAPEIIDVVEEAVFRKIVEQKSGPATEIQKPEAVRRAELREIDRAEKSVVTRREIRCVRPADATGRDAVVD